MTFLSFTRTEATGKVTGLVTNLFIINNWYFSIVHVDLMLLLMVVVLWVYFVENTYVSSTSILRRCRFLKVSDFSIKCYSNDVIDNLVEFKWFDNKKGSWWSVTCSNTYATNVNYLGEKGLNKSSITKSHIKLGLQFSNSLSRFYSIFFISK